MRALYRPGIVLDGVRVPSLDEDEATMAVAAARALLKTRSIDRSTITRLECASTTGTGWARHVQVALGLAHATLSETIDGPLREQTLRITSNAPRRGDRADPEALAVADMVGNAKDIDVSEKSPRAIDAAKAEKVAAWESKALLQVPMGAYVPRATWDASLEARYRLVAGYCPRCRRGQIPRIDPCPVCGGKTDSRELAGPGNLYTHTVIAAGGGPTEFDPLQDADGTYGVGVIDFGDMIRIAGILTETDLTQLFIGQKMEPVFRRIYAQEGSWRYGTKFRPARTQ